MMAGLTVRQVDFSYGKAPLLQQVDLAVPEGDIVCLVGPSGCGKTTLLKLLSGLLPCASGTVLLDEKDVTRMRPEQRRIGMVLQQPSLFPHLTVLENVQFGMASSLRRQRSQALAYLKKMDMAGQAECYPHMLSGGQQQRVAVARALAHRPQALLLDEPFANLDVVLRKAVREETFALLEAEGIPSLMVTHDPEEALHMADRLYVLDQGKIVQHGSAQELYDNPKNAFVAGFFGHMNCFDAVVKQGKAKLPFAEIAVPSSDAGAKVQVYIRPEDVVLGAKTSSKAGFVVEKLRFLGFYTLLYLREQRSGVLLRTRVLDAQGFALGQSVEVQVHRAFVFPQ